MLKYQIKVNPTTTSMRLELQVKVYHLGDVPLVSRMGPVVIELLLIVGQLEEMVSRTEQSSNAMPLQKSVWEKWIKEENACHME